MKTKLPLAIIASFLLSTSCFADSVLCVSVSTGGIKARNSCKSGELLLTAKNFANAIGVTGKPSQLPSNTSTTVDLSTCYTTKGQKSSTPFDGRIAVGVQCTKSNHVLFQHEFSTSDSNGAAPKLESQRLIFSGILPNGIEITTRGDISKFYTLNVTAVCCNQK